MTPPVSQGERAEAAAVEDGQFWGYVLVVLAVAVVAVTAFLFWRILA
jgi:hypothetical protein